MTAGREITLGAASEAPPAEFWFRADENVRQAFGATRDPKFEAWARSMGVFHPSHRDPLEFWVVLTNSSVLSRFVLRVRQNRLSEEQGGADWCVDVRSAGGGWDELVASDKPRATAGVLAIAICLVCMVPGVQGTEVKK